MDLPARLHMSKMPASVADKKAIGARIQGLIDRAYTKFADFEKAHPDIAGTVYNWTPPKRRWAAAPGGAKVRRIDWEAINIPQADLLARFCDALGVSADYIISGVGPEYRAQSRPLAGVATEVAAWVTHQLAKVMELRGAHISTSVLSVNGGAVLEAATELVASEIAEWQAWLRRDYSLLFRSTERVLDDLERAMTAGDGERVAELRPIAGDYLAELAAMYRTPKYFTVPDNNIFYRMCGSPETHARLLERGAALLSRPTRKKTGKAGRRELAHSRPGHAPGTRRDG